MARARDTWVAPAMHMRDTCACGGAVTHRVAHNRWCIAGNAMEVVKRSRVLALRAHKFPWTCKIKVAEFLREFHWF